MRLRTTVLLAIAVGAVHLAIAVGSLLLGFSLGMARFDAPQAIERGMLEKTTSWLAGTLLEPGLTVWSIIRPAENASAIAEWTVVLMNSMLWGATLAILVTGARAMKARR